MNKTESIALWLRDKGDFTTSREVSKHFGFSLAHTASLITMMIRSKRYTTQVRGGGRGKTRYVRVVNVKPEHVSGVQAFLYSVDTTLYTATQLTEMYGHKVSRECIRNHLRVCQLTYRRHAGVRLETEQPVNNNATLINKVFK